MEPSTQQDTPALPCQLDMQSNPSFPFPRVQHLHPPQRTSHRAKEMSCHENQDQALSFILAQLLQRQRTSQINPTPAEVLSSLGMGWEIICAETNLAHPEMGMIPVHRHSLLPAQLATTQGFDGMALGMWSSDLPRQSDKCKPGNATSATQSCSLALLENGQGGKLLRINENNQFRMY